MTAPTTDLQALKREVEAAKRDHAAAQASLDRAEEELRTAANELKTTFNVSTVAEARGLEAQLTAQLSELISKARATLQEAQQ